MSITTRRGDQGETDLLFGRRIPKSDLRIHALGSVDEVNSALGLVRLSKELDSEQQEQIAEIQSKLIVLMGQIACDPLDESAYANKGFHSIGNQEVAKIEDWSQALESQLLAPKGWSIPGAAGNESAARCDLARSICRRAERDLVDLAETDPHFAPEQLYYLNRLSDFLWLLARKIEQEN